MSDVVIEPPIIGRAGKRGDLEFSQLLKKNRTKYVPWHMWRVKKDEMFARKNRARRKSEENKKEKRTISLRHVNNYVHSIQAWDFLSLCLSFLISHDGLITGIAFESGSISPNVRMRT